MTIVKPDPYEQQGAAPSLFQPETGARATNSGKSGSYCKTMYPQNPAECRDNTTHYPTEEAALEGPKVAMALLGWWSRGGIEIFATIFEVLSSGLESSTDTKPYLVMMVR